jgi:M6 family metalloprotease-like protein
MNNIARIFIAALLTVLLVFLTCFTPIAMAQGGAQGPLSTFMEKRQPLSRLFSFFHNKLIPFPEISPALGECPLLLVLIEFSDVPHCPLHDHEYFEQLLFGERPSVKDYYEEASYGKFTFTKAGILGWYKSFHSVMKQSRDGIVREAFRKAARDHSVDFKSYDKNGDCMLTANELDIIICTSGCSLEKPMGAYHNWRLWGVRKIRTWDGMILSGEHSVIQEWHSWMVPAHELGHSLLLPDLYDYTRNSRGIGIYGLMGLGNLDGTNGHHFTAWSKVKLGWIEPTIITKDGYYTIHDAETCPEAYILRDPARSEHEYFLVENRFRGSSYDNGTTPLPDEGIMIYHIDESVPRLCTPRTWFPWVNNVEKHKMIDVECADSVTSHVNDADDLDKNANDGDEHDFWDINEYGFNSTSTPCNSRWYDGTSNNIGIYVLSEPGKTMTVYLSVNGTVPSGGG